MKNAAALPLKSEARQWQVMAGNGRRRMRGHLVNSFQYVHCSAAPLKSEAGNGRKRRRGHLVNSFQYLHCSGISLKSEGG